MKIIKNTVQIKDNFILSMNYQFFCIFFMLFLLNLLFFDKFVIFLCKILNFFIRMII